MPDDVQIAVTKIVADTLKTRGITVPPEPEMSLIDSGILDSLSLVTFVGQLENEFGIELSMADLTLNNFDNIQLITALVRSKRSGG